MLKMTARRTSIKAIEDAITENWIKHLAFYHLLKFHYKNSCIYNYKHRMDEVANQFNLSPKTLYNYFKILMDRNLVFDHSGNLIIRSIRHFGLSRKKTTIYLDDSKTVFDITCLLYAKILEDRAKKQAFKESVRRFGKGDQFKSGLCGNPFLPSLSFRTIAKILHISENKAFRVVKNLNKLGVIKSQKQKPQLKGNVSAVMYSIEDLPGYRFAIGNNLYEQYGCKHDFLQFPVCLRNITIRQFKIQVNRVL
jgi:hypothetical protein